MVDTPIQEMTETLLANDDALGYLEERGLSLNTIVDAQLGYVSMNGTRFGHSIAIPYLDAQGRWRSTRYRHLRPNMSHKYDQLKGTRQHLYGVERVNEPVVYLCEGEFDSLVLTQMGFPAAGIAGATNFDRSWRFLFRNSDLVLVVMDSDDAGRKAAMRIAAQISTVTNADIIELPPGKDVTDTYLESPDLLRSLCELPS